ncbi:hypothetical protein BST97_02815 [Nonlabens spongiae]|uniref:DUF1206 domain-containing protein n=1 Tax=Nonlabens spongiae TaxID=331648 RepID=A0A1W6MHE8_9FLAO|nr:DUF1206 domain-containing protein [Nonlabens spongiae]ARN77015.1 hypothetical protein BST97_02815 [Nonlabens spongiae]
MKASRRFARYGIFIKGVVFFLMGALAALTASKVTYQLKGGRDILEWISALTFGWFLLLLITVGIAGYVFSRFYLAFNKNDYEGYGKNKIRRFAYFINGIGYIALLFTCIKLLIGAGFSEGNQRLFVFLLSKWWGMYILIITSVGLGVSALNEWYMAFGTMINKMILENQLTTRNYKLLLALGRVGRFSRGIVFGVFSYLFFKVIVGWSNEVPKSTGEAFTFLSIEYGSWTMGIVASGLALYGLYLILSAKHRNIPIY